MNLANADLQAYTAPLMADGVLSIGLENLSKRDQKTVLGVITATDNLLSQSFKVEPVAEVTFKTVNASRFTRLGMPGALALARQVNGKWNILVREVFDRRIQRLMFWHEMGHVLGLQHPFTGDPFASEVPTTDVTVMSYKLGTNWPARWRKADRDALTGLWNK